MTARIGFWTGLGLFAAILLAPAPAGLSPDGWRVAALMVLMATWWFTEAIPIAATALLPFLTLPLLTDRTAGDVAGDYYSPILFLVLGGALVALAIERVGLHGRVARAIVARGGERPAGLLLAFMIATALISTIVSNTATTLIMIPIALALIRARGDVTDGFAAALVLGVAYAATIGGLGTLVGSPTNAIAAGLIDKSLGVRIDFLTWMAFGMPIVIVAIPAAAWLLARLHRIAHAPMDRAAVLGAIGATGALSPPEKRLLPLIAALIAAWVLLPLLQDVPALAKLDDGMVAIAAALLLFVIPDGRGRRLLTWGEARAAPFDVILLFGGGLALAAAITASGLATWIGLQLGGLTALPLWLLAGLVVLLVVVVTEFASNVATASGFIPVIAGLSTAMGLPVEALALPAALASSWGFMMPAGTGPNAIAYATGEVTVGQMVRAGFVLDLAGIPLIVGVCLGVAALL